MAFKKLLPFAAVSTVSGLSGVAGWFLKEKEVEQQMHIHPGPFIEKMARRADDPAKIYAAVAVQAMNRSGRLKMAGATFTDEITPGVTRRSVHANVYSRIAAGSTVIALREKSDGIEILLLKNKRKPGRLLPSEGYGKFGPLTNTGTHFSDLDGHDMDKAEELILKGPTVDEAYQKVAAETGSGKHGYGDFDRDFIGTALREPKEETGVILDNIKQVYQEVGYNKAWGLHTCVTGFLTILNDDVERFFMPDSTEIESIYMIKLADIEVLTNGSGRVKGFAEIIPADYIKRFEKGIIAYEEMQLEKISGGRITKIAELEEYATRMGRECPKLILFGADQHASSQAFRDFTKSIVVSLDVALGCMPFLKESGRPSSSSEKDSKSELTG